MCVSAHVCYYAIESEREVFDPFSRTQVQAGLSCSCALSIGWGGPLSKSSPVIFTLSDPAPCPCGWQARWTPICFPVQSFRLRGRKRKFPLRFQAHVLCSRISNHGSPTFESVGFCWTYSLPLQNTLHPFLPCSVHGAGCPVWFTSICSLAPPFS